jgi:hypothetical protein
MKDVRAGVISPEMGSSLAFMAQHAVKALELGKANERRSMLRRAGKVELPNGTVVPLDD